MEDTTYMDLTIPSWIYSVKGVDTLTEAAILAKVYSLAPNHGMETNCTVTYLCEVTLCTRRNVTNIINKLCEKGLVKRGDTDYASGVRRMHLSVTDKVRNYIDSDTEIIEKNFAIHNPQIRAARIYRGNTIEEEAYKRGATDQDPISRADEREKVIKKLCKDFEQFKKNLQQDSRYTKQ